jgi:hypothetical protein
VEVRGDKLWPIVVFIRRKERKYKFIVILDVPSTELQFNNGIFYIYLILLHN